MASLRQASFAGGELSPSMWGRTDTKLYLTGLATLRNFIVTSQGRALNRPGFRWVDTFDAGTHTPSTMASLFPVRLIPFVYSDTDSFVLVFSLNQIDVYQNGTHLKPLTVNNVGGFNNIATIYANADLPFLKFAQLGDVLTVSRQGL